VNAQLSITVLVIVRAVQFILNIMSDPSLAILRYYISVQCLAVLCCTCTSGNALPLASTKYSFPYFVIIQYIFHMEAKLNNITYCLHSALCG
jgi:hypothetical protein